MTPCRQPTETDPATGQTAFAQDFGHNRMKASSAAVRMIIDKSHGRPIQNRSIYPTTLIVRDSTRPLEISEPH